ncbi:MAG: hypothetical protein EVA88_01925 [Rhodospirillaceae bacterium]|nr:MAG: hypothetical protein EVA88_01925 [Rhodospirillaceae bacterium]
MTRATSTGGDRLSIVGPPDGLTASASAEGASSLQLNGPVEFVGAHGLSLSAQDGATLDPDGASFTLLGRSQASTSR